MKGVIVLAASMLVLSSTGYASNTAYIGRIRMGVSTSPIAQHHDPAAFSKVLQEAQSRALDSGYGVIDKAGRYVTLRATGYANQIGGKWLPEVPKKDALSANKSLALGIEDGTKGVANKVDALGNISAQYQVSYPIAGHFNPLQFRVQYLQATGLGNVKELSLIKH